METTLIKDPNLLLAVLRQLPGNYLILEPNAPHFTIAEVSEGYNITTRLTREQLIGKHLFEVFPDNPEKSYPSGVEKLRNSLLTVINTKESHEMPALRYDVQFPESDLFEEKHWLPANKPVIVDNQVVYIIHMVDDITEKRKLKDSENYFKALADETPFIVWRSINGMCNYVNKAWIDFTGLTFQESLGTGYRKIFHPDDLGNQNRLFEKAIASRSAYQAKFRIKRKDGTYRWVLSKASPTLLDEQYLEYIGSLIDITEQEEARKKVEESEAKLFRMLNSIPQITWTNSPEGKVTFYNQQSSIYSGFNYHDTSDWSMTVHPEDIEATTAHFYRILKSKKSGEFQSRYKNTHGEYRWFLNRLEPLKNADGIIELWIGTATDIQQLKLLQEQKEDFISIASHEIKTPITSLKVSLQLLNRMKDAPSAKMVPALIAQANKGVEKVSALIDDLLNVSSMNRKKLLFNKRLFNISSLIEESFTHIKIEGIYQIVTTGDHEAEVYADIARIEQVIVNFVNNAIKYAAKSKTIKIHIEKINSTVKVSVTDSGNGIHADKLPFIFDRYYRVESEGDEISGLGLGLFICAEIIKGHGGEIGVESELTKGTTFWFMLPIGHQND